MAKKNVRGNAKDDVQKIIKTAVNGVLIAFILFSIGFAMVKSGFGKKEMKTLEGPAAIIATPGTESAVPTHPVVQVGADVNVAAEKGRVILYYLHSTGRCHNCILMEQYAKEAVDKYFQKQQKSGQLEFKIFNFDEAEHRHFVQDYRLVTKSLVISLVKDGKEVKYENLTGIWQNVRSQEGYHQYVKSNVERYLKEAK